MIFEMPYIKIAGDATMGKRVAVFCDNAIQAKHTQEEVYRHCELGGAVSHPRKRTIDVGDGKVSFFLLNGYDGRGYNAEVVYLSESARRQYEYASIVNAEVR